MPKRKTKKTTKATRGASTRKVRRSKTRGRTGAFLHRFGVIGLLVFAIGIQLIGNSTLGGGWSQKGSVLAYATNVSVSGLQASQNNQRTSNGLAALTLNTQLNSAAQAKANDMVARNYWSHNTPEGNPPWVFITNAGYSYTKAGENLAYGFDSSDGVVAGWMNSASHRANVLDTAYKDVGFGIANGANYQGGANTVVVAMYGQPAAVAPAPAPTPPPTAKPKATPAPAPTPTPAPTPAPAPQPTPEPIAPTPEPTPTTTETEKKEDKKAVAFTTNNSGGNQPPSIRSSNLRSVLSGSAHWTAYTAFVATLAAGVWFATKHTLAFKRAMIDGEEYVLTHPAFEVSLLTAAMLLLFVGTSGVIR